MSGLKTKFNAPLLHLRRQEFTVALRAEIRVQLQQAARAFLRAVIKRVPVDTGEARGTLLPLGRFLNVAVPITPKSTRDGKDPGTGEMDHPLIFDFESTVTSEYFTAQLQLFHYWWNDFFTQSYKNPQIEPPWHSIDDGVDAFINYIETKGYTRLPRLRNFTFVSTCNVNGGNRFILPERPI